MRSLVLIIGFAITILGVLWYSIYSKPRVEKHGAVEEYVKEEGLETKGDKYRVLVPIANPNTQRHLLEIAAASASTKKRGKIIALNVIEVPPQTSLAHSARYEEEKIERRRELLENAREFAEEMNVELETRAVVARNLGSVINNVLEEDKINHLVLGRGGGLSPKEHILGSKIDPIIAEATSCEVSVVKSDGKKIGDVVAFVGEGPNTLAVIEQAYKLSKSLDSTSLTLLNVQIEEGKVSKEKLIENGREHVKEMAKETELEEHSYKTNIITSKEQKNTLVKESNKYDTVCVGAPREARLEKSLFGTLAEKIVRSSNSTVVT